MQMHTLCIDDLLSPSRPSQSNQAVDAHTAMAPAPPDPISAGGRGLIYDIRWGCEIP